MMTVFDIANIISKDKTDHSSRFDTDPEFRGQYNQYMLNRILACAPDLIYLAEVANNLNVDDKTHYLFWHNIIEKKFRFFKYPKKKNENLDDIKLLSHYYNVSIDEATIIAELLTKEQVKNISKTYDYGK